MSRVAGFSKHAWLPLLVFAATLVHGATIGLTDDEAYYWVLAQKPALGYAFHPPAVALSIAAVQAGLGWLFGHHSVLLVRLPAALSAALLVAMGMRWVRRAGGEHAERAGAVIVGFAGMFALSWMIVPDLPLFVGWTIAFLATWEVCFGEGRQNANLLWLAAGSALAILSKYSGVLGAASAFAAIWLWAPRERKLKATLALALGCAAAAVPILWWNSQHHWASILYQIRERHGDARFSGIRTLRFWAVELVLMGPALAIYALGLCGRALPGRARRTASAAPLCSRGELFALAWMAPGALVFCLQPMWGDFKPHWALIVWWPLVLALALRASRGEQLRLARAHFAYGLAVIALVWTCCHLPLGAWTMSRLATVTPDPRLDVTNDLYGWPELRQQIRAWGGEEALKVGVVGSRYQTASQAAFALGEDSRVTLLPRDLKAMDEWPDIEVSDTQGPEWPRLRKTVFYVADNRYDAPPEYPGAACVRAKTFESSRSGYLAKTIFLWKCEPQSSRP